MKIKKIICLAIIILSALAVLSTESFAALTWYNCTITKVGPFGVNETSSTRVYLTEEGGTFVDKECSISYTRAKEYMAVILTAVSLGKKVSVYMNGDADIPSVRGLYLLND